jgi:hypothetical protein
MPYGPFAKSATAEDYEFHCSAADCSEHAHNAEDFCKCGSCHALICREHSHRPQDMPYLVFCEACFRCASCGGEAWAMCEECGDLRCREHIVAHAERVDDWNLGDTMYSCSDVCQAAHHKSVMREMGQLRSEGVA